MANSKQDDNAPSRTHSDHPQQQQPDEQAAQAHEPPIKQVNPDHEGLNPDHLGPAQPRKPRE